jgi:type I restriction enzyme S subunit
VRQQIENAATGSSKSMKNISQDAIRRLVVPLPPLEEQRSIVEAATAVTDLTDKEQAVLAERRRLKAALAESLLSGRLRVRDAA